MPELTLNEIDRISRDVRSQEITFSHLADELIDHICCDVEYEMMHGLEFHDAYRSVRERIGTRRLKEIQEDTLYSVDTKYRKMKKTMKISGIAGTGLLGIAAMFKIMHWPGAGIMMTLGALALAFVFLPSSLTVLWKESHSGKRLFLFISAFFAGMFFIVGILFKIQHWPVAGVVLALAVVTALFFLLPALLTYQLKRLEDKTLKKIYILGAIGLVFYIIGLFCKIQHYPGANIMLLTGVIFLFFIVFPWYSYLKWKDEYNISSGFLFIVIGSVALVVPSLLVSLNLQRSYEVDFYSHQREQQALFNYSYNINSEYRSACNDTADARLMSEVDAVTEEILNLVSGIEKKMVTTSEGKPGTPADAGLYFISSESGNEIRYAALKRPFNISAYSYFLAAGTETRTMLDDSLQKYSSYIASFATDNAAMAYTRLLDPSAYFDVASSVESVPLMRALHMTALLKNSILAAEAMVLKSITNKAVTKN